MCFFTKSSFPLGCQKNLSTSCPCIPPGSIEPIALPSAIIFMGLFKQATFRSPGHFRHTLQLQLTFGVHTEQTGNWCRPHESKLSIYRTRFIGSRKWPRTVTHGVLHVMIHETTKRNDVVTSNRRHRAEMPIVQSACAHRGRQWHGQGNERV